MKKYYVLLVIILLITFIGVACNSISSNLSSNSTTKKTEPLIETPTINVNYYNATLVTEPASISPNKPVKLVFSVQDYLTQDVGLKDLEIVHEKPMHLIIISEDLFYFNHIHPQPTADNSIFTVETEFPLAGKYRLYLDYSPKRVGHRLGRIELVVPGATPSPVPLVADKEDTHSSGGVKVTFKPEKPLQSNDAVTLNFIVTDEKTGQPVTDIEPYLGAFAHFNIVNQGHTEYLHAHPLKEAESPNERSGPEIGTRTIFPTPGLYKIWAQFQRKGKVIVVPFVVNVAEGKPKENAVVAKADDGVQKLKITVGENGFQPASLQLKPGIPTQITFLRTDEKNCAHEILFEELGIRKDLPLGKEILVEFTPTKPEYDFSCGMGMLHGTVLVKN